MAATNTIEIIIRATDKATKELKAMQGAFSGISDGLLDTAASAAKTAAAIGGVAFAGKKLLDFGSYGATVMQTADSFEMLLAHIGAAPDLLRQLQQASRGTISDMQLMSATSTLLAGAQGELATNLANATPELMEIAKAANKLNPTLGDTAFLYQSLATGIKRASPMILDNLGLTIRVGEANEAYAKALGKSVDQLTAEEQKQALLNETLRAGRVLIEQAGGAGDAAADDYLRLTAEINNLKDALAQNLAGPLADVVRKLTDLASTNADAASNLSATGVMAGGAAAAFLLLAPRILETAKAMKELSVATRGWLGALGVGLLGGNWLSKELTGQGMLGWLTDTEGAERGLARANELATASWEDQTEAMRRARQEIEVLRAYDVLTPSQEAIDIMGGVWQASSAQAVRDAIAERRALILELSKAAPVEFQVGPSLAELRGEVGRLAGVLDRLDPAVIRARNQAIGEMGDFAQASSDSLYNLATAAGTVAQSFGQIEFDDQTLWKMAAASGASLQQLSLLADTLGIASDAEIDATLEAYRLIEAFGKGLISEDELNKAWQQIGQGMRDAEQAIRDADLGGALKYQRDEVEAAIADITTAISSTQFIASNVGKVRPPLKDEELELAMKPAEEVRNLYQEIGTAAATLDQNMTTAWLNSYGNAVALQEPMLILQGNIEDNTEAALELGRVIVEEVPDDKPMDIHIEEEARLFERMYELKSIHEILGKPVVMRYIVDVEGQLPGVPSVPRYATGTDYHPGGLAVVGESGPELVNLPRGARVYPTGGGGAGAANITININGAIDPSVTANMVMQRLRDQGIARGTPLR